MDEGGGGQRKGRLLPAVPVLCKEDQCRWQQSCSGVWFSRPGSSRNSKGMCEMSKQHCCPECTTYARGCYERKPACHSTSRAAQCQPDSKLSYTGEGLLWSGLGIMVKSVRSGGGRIDTKISLTVYAFSTLLGVCPAKLPFSPTHPQEASQRRARLL